MITPLTNLPKKRRISIGIVGFTLLWLFLLYGRSLYQVTPDAFRWLWLILGPLNLTLDFLNPLFASPIILLGSYLLGIGLILWAVINHVQRRSLRIALLLCGLTALFFPLIMPWAYGTYQLPVQAVEGYKLQWVTKPRNVYSDSYKRAQHTHESGCDYTLIGWSVDGMFFYQTDCWPGVWRYNVVTEETEWSLFLSLMKGSEPAHLDTTTVQRWDAQRGFPETETLQQAGQYPFKTLEKAMSPDGQWEVLVVKWYYGPGDIVVVSQVESFTP